MMLQMKKLSLIKIQRFAWNPGLFKPEVILLLHQDTLGKKINISIVFYIPYWVYRSSNEINVNDILEAFVLSRS